MSYRKLIALTVFGAAVFLQGCEDDDEAARIECSAANIDLSDDADPALAALADVTGDNLFKSINDEIEVKDSKLVDEATGCVACLLAEGATYQAKDAKALTADNFEEQLSCWATNAAMKECGATDDLPDCLTDSSEATPCASATTTTIAELDGDCALCVGEEDTSDAAKTVAAIAKCGLAGAGACSSHAEITLSDGDLTFSELETALEGETYSDATCGTCVSTSILAATSAAGSDDPDKTECELLSASVGLCGVKFSDTVSCQDNE